MELFADKTATTLCLAGVLLIALVVLRRSAKALGGGRREGAAPRASSMRSAGSAGHHLDAPAEWVQWEVQMHELARDATAQLDTKLRLLAELIRQADQCAARLTEAVARAEHSAGSPASAGDRLWSPPERCESGMELDGEDVAHVRHHATAVDDPRYREIYALADDGYSTAAIAHRTGQPIGEVELILSLRGRD